MRIVKTMKYVGSTQVHYEYRVRMVLSLPGFWTNLLGGFEVFADRQETAPNKVEWRQFAFLGRFKTKQKAMSYANLWLDRIEDPCPGEFV